MIVLKKITWFIQLLLRRVWVANFHRQILETLQTKGTWKGVCCYCCLQQLNTKPNYPDESWQNLDPLATICVSRAIVWTLCLSYNLMWMTEFSQKWASHVFKHAPKTIDPFHQSGSSGEIISQKLIPGFQMHEINEMPQSMKMVSIAKQCFTTA